MTFLAKYWFSSLGLNFWIASLAIQWYILFSFFWKNVFSTEIISNIVLSVDKLVYADFAAASVLICFGALLGKTSLNQMTFVTLSQVFFYSLNEYINNDFIGLKDVGGSIVIHTFGAYFGLAVSFIITKFQKLNTEEESNYTSDLFSMIGTIFLWIYWPSFNSAVAKPELKDIVIINTVLSLTSSCMFAFITSKIYSSKSKFSMVHIQNATLAGGVAVGVVSDLFLLPCFSLMVGAVAGVLSVLGYKFIQPFLHRKINLHDTCGVHNLHGLPGVLGGLCSVSVFIYYADFEQTLKQISGIAITLVLAIFSGIVTGKVLKFMKGKDKYFADAEEFDGIDKEEFNIDDMVKDRKTIAELTEPLVKVEKEKINSIN